MADYAKAFDKTMGNEGGYSNHPSDTGGETYRGISRRAHPLWPGWAKIDSIRNDPGFSEIIKYIPGIDEEVRRFYKTYYWDCIHGDMIPHQLIAEKLFDFAVNAGCKTAIKFLQESLNIINMKGFRWPDVEVDGIMGPSVMRAIAEAIKKYEDVLMAMFKGRMINHYYTIMCKNPEQECFAINWIRRAVKA